MVKRVLFVLGFILAFLAIPMMNAEAQLDDPCKICAIDGSEASCLGTTDPVAQTLLNCSPTLHCIHVPTPLGVIEFCYPRCNGQTCLWV